MIRIELLLEIVIYQECLLCNFNFYELTQQNRDSYFKKLITYVNFIITSTGKILLVRIVRKFLLTKNRLKFLLS